MASITTALSIMRAPNIDETRAQLYNDQLALRVEICRAGVLDNLLELKVGTRTRVK